MKDYIKEFGIIHRGCLNMASEKLNGCEIRGHIIPYLLIICEKPGISQDEISKSFHIDKGSVARTISRMIDEGLVIRKENPDNRRQNMIYPTDKLKEIQSLKEKGQQKMNVIITEGIDENELQIFEKVLKKMQDNILKAEKERTGK